MLGLQLLPGHSAAELHQVVAAIMQFSKPWSLLAHISAWIHV